MTEYLRNDQTNVDLNFGLSHQAIAVARYVHEYMANTFLRDNDATVVCDADGLEIGTQVLLNGRERGLVLSVRFYGKFEEGEGSPLLVEKLINFGESRGSDDIFVMESEWWERGEGGTFHNSLITIDHFGEVGWSLRKQFKEGAVGKAAEHIVKIIRKLYKEAKRVEREIEKEESAARKAS